MSSRQYQLNEDNVLEILSATNNEAKDIHPEDPLTKSRIRVTLDQLKPYDNNPRTTRNPKFDDILVSIENAGLEQPPNVSRRSPNDPHYMIIDGGNTRLEILNLLHAKYQRLAEAAEDMTERLVLTQKAESFFIIDCIFKPWERESKALAGHMSENENRGGMLFIEKALAVQKQRKLYEEEDREKATKAGKEFDAAPLSMRKLAERITADGWTISASHITRYDYAANTLLKGMSEVFWAGAGHSLVRELRKYDTAYTRYWQESEAGQADPDQIETQFLEALSEADGESFYMKGFLRSLNERLAKLLGSDPNTISIEVGAILNGAIDLPLSGDSDGDPEPQPPFSQRLPLSERVNELRGSFSAPPSPPESPAQNPLRPSSKRTQSAAGQYSPITQSDRPVSHAAFQPAVAATTGHPAEMNDVDQVALVGLIMDRVRPLAERYGIDVFEVTLEDIANGSNPFFIKPVKRVFQPGDDDEAAATWWALTKYSFSAQLDRPNQYRSFEQTLLNVFHHYIEEHGTAGALIHIEECTLGKGSHALFEALNEIQRLCALYIHRAIASRGRKTQG
jgi:ParB family protein of integrating conjugative element (PFGI_1 class)